MRKLKSFFEFHFFFVLIMTYITLTLANSRHTVSTTPDSEDGSCGSPKDPDRRSEWRNVTFESLKPSQTRLHSRFYRKGLGLFCVAGEKDSFCFGEVTFR